MPIVPGYPCFIPGYPGSIPGYPSHIPIPALSLAIPAISLSIPPLSLALPGIPCCPWVIICSLSLTMVEEGPKLQFLGIKGVLVLINMAAMT